MNTTLTDEQIRELLNSAQSKRRNISVWAHDVELMASELLRLRAERDELIEKHAEDLRQWSVENMAYGNIRLENARLSTEVARLRAGYERAKELRDTWNKECSFGSASSAYKYDAADEILKGFE